MQNYTGKFKHISLGINKCDDIFIKRVDEDIVAMVKIDVLDKAALGTHPHNGMGTGWTHGQTDRLAQLAMATITGSSYIYSEVQGATLIASQTLARVRRTFTGDSWLPCGR